MSSQKPRNGLILHAIILAVTGVFCLACLILSMQMPRLMFETNVQATPGGSALIVKRVYSQTDDIQPGDVIEAISGKPVQTKAAFYHQLLHEKDTAELTIRRTNNRFQRPVSASEFEHGALPAGLRASDKPILIAGEDGTYSQLDGVDFDTLRSMLKSRSGAVSVVFKRQENVQEEIINTTVELRGAADRTFGAALAFLLLGLMGCITWQNVKNPRNRKAPWANLSIGLGVIGCMTLGLWSILQSMPILLMLGIISLTLYKAVDLDYHIVGFGSKRPETWIRIALFAGPAATLIIPIWICLGEMPVLWGGIVSSEVELKPDTFAYLPMIWAVIYTFVDGGIHFVRHRRHTNASFLPYEIGIVLACLLSTFVFVLLNRDMMGAQWFLIAVILVQCISDALPHLISSQPSENIRLDNPMFSLTPVRNILLRAGEIIGSNWLIQLVIDRPAPRHVVALVTSDDEMALSGIEMNVLSTPWRDFLEVFRVEGGCITGESHDHDSRDPVLGIADRLGIVIALPIADGIAGTLTSLTFLVSTPGEPVPGTTPSISLSAKQRDELSELMEELAVLGPALVYQSAEMSLDYVGDDLDEVMRKVHETASFARAIRNQTEPLNAQELPHGLIDEEEIEENTADNEPIVVQNPEVGVDEYDTKVYEEEVLFLRSQVQALYSQQLREFALAEIEFTEAQKSVLNDLKSIDPPILFVGEPGTGKRLIALAAHEARSNGAFLTIDAAEIPESIFALDVFGDGDNPGLIKDAAGGSLFIQNVDRLSNSLLGEVLEAIQKIPAHDSIGLYMAVNVGAETFSISQYRLDPMRLPKYLRELASRCDAEVIVLEPLRVQDDLDIVAEFFRQKQALRTNRAVESFSSEALLALKSYRWPGNFNEMRSVIERAVMRCESSIISVSDLGRDFEDLADASTKDIAISGTDVFREQAQMLQALSESQQAQIERLSERIVQLENQNRSVNGSSEMDDAFFEGSFVDIEKRLLDRLLDKYQRDPEKAAEALDLNRTRFFNKLSKYQLIKWDND